MKKAEIIPEAARVKGNLISDWDDLLSHSSFEDFHVSREKSSNINWQGINKKTIRLNSRAEPVLMDIQVGSERIMPDTETSTLAINLTYHERTGGTSYEVEPVPYQPVYIYDDDILIASVASDVEGNVEYEYSSSNSGRHTITVSTPHLNGFDSCSETVEVIVLFVSTMELSPVYTLDLPFGTGKELVATLKDNLNNPVPNKPVVFYEGVRRLGTVTTDNEGNARWTYLESDNRGEPVRIQVVSNPVFYEDEDVTVTGVLTTLDGTPLANKRVYLYHQYQAYYRAYDLTDSNGEFSLVYRVGMFPIPVDFFVVFQSTVEDTVDNEYELLEPNFVSIGEKTVNPREEGTYLVMGTGYTVFFADKLHITGGLFDSGVAISGATIRIYDDLNNLVDTVTTLSDGSFTSDTIIVGSWDKNNKLFRAVYNGGGGYDSCEASFRVVMRRYVSSVDYGEGASPFSLVDGSPFYWSGTPTVAPSVNSDGTLNIGELTNPYYYLPLDSGTDWKAIFNVKLTIGARVYFDYFANGNANRRILRITSPQVAFIEGEGNYIGQDSITTDTNNQFVIIEKIGNQLLFSYPNSNGGITVINTSYSGTTNKRLKITSNTPNDTILMNFTYLDSTGGGG